MPAKPKNDHVAHNVSIYSLNGIAPYYAREPLQPPEIQILIKYAEEFKGKTVLDIGVGTGRTSKYLVPCCARYVGIELNRDMLALFGERQPHVELFECDMRHYKSLNKDRFDFVIGPYSAFDSLNHADRLQMFDDIHAMMNPGGLFVFSTHNLNWGGIGESPRFERARDPVRMLRNFLAHRACVRNHKRMKRLEERHATYAILNDISHQWLALLYYMTRSEQTRHLKAAGFKVLEVYDQYGMMLEEGSNDSHCAVLYYVCRRGGLKR